MNSSGDAAEQVVRLSLEGTEVALKLTGSAAKNIAAALYTIYKYQDILLASGLDATDVKCCATTFFTLKTSVLVGIQARELAIECICQADG